MQYLRGTIKSLLAQQSGQIQLFIIAPILTLSFLSLVVRTASSAVDSSLEKKKVMEQLKRRLSEVQNERQPEGESAKTPTHSRAPISAKLPVQIQKYSLKVPAPQPPRLTLHPSPAQQLMLPLQATVKVDKKKTTLASLLNGEGIEKDELNVWLAAAKKQKELRKLAVGRILDLSFSLSKKDNDRELRTLA